MALTSPVEPKKRSSQKNQGEPKQPKWVKDARSQQQKKACKKHPAGGGKFKTPGRQVQSRPKNGQANCQGKPPA
jgi:hypothetical protein